MNRSPETGLIIFIFSAKFNAIRISLAAIDKYYSTTAVGGYSEKSTRFVLLPENEIIKAH
ncbi:hypothetical protein [Thalassotalea sp. PLHSN55]|uniref:hypothetical protein n=1 Tax=Thalassotalea sp. PLHSN55 TaxID=3435888 RepID=UPI003F86EDAB